MKHEDFQDARFPGMEPQPIEHEDELPAIAEVVFMAAIWLAGTGIVVSAVLWLVTP